MKKSIRVIALVLSAAALCVSLCSCQYLDDARANTAVYDDNSMESLTFRDRLYKRITLPTGLEFIMAEVYSGRYVTAPDVPVLLNSTFGDVMNYDLRDGETPRIIRVYRQFDRYDSRLEERLIDDFDSASADQETYPGVLNYVREDQYEAVKRIVDEAVLDHYWTLNFQLVDSTDPWKGGKYLPEPVDDAATQVISRTLSSDDVVSWRDIPTTEWYGLYLEMCDQTLTVTNNSRSLTVLSNGNDYYLYYSDDVKKLYHVPADGFSVMHELCRKYETGRQPVDTSYFRSNAD